MTSDDTVPLPDHPALRIYSGTLPRSLEALNAHPALADLALRFAPYDQREIDRHGGYERCIDATGRIPTRDGSLHDWLNALVWLHFPQTKHLLHEIAIDPAAAIDARNGRSPRQNAAALFDEVGAVALCSQPCVVRELRELRWRLLFQRPASEFRVVIIGHGTLESLVDPHIGLTSKTLTLHVDAHTMSLAESKLAAALDARVREQFAGRIATPADLLPLPILGVRGWYPDQSDAFYANERYFRTRRQRM